MTTQRVFDRLPEFDPRSRLFSIVSALPREATRPRNCRWKPGPILDQGTEGACVGFGWTAELTSTPRVITDVGKEFARSVYAQAQLVDEWEGQSYSGTSVLAGAKIVRTLGYIREYRWAFTLLDLQLALSWSGPVVLGLNWYEGMFTPDANAHISPVGSVLGGHCILAYGINVTDQYILLRNSWGPTWGRMGSCRVSFADMDHLLHDDGEACIPVGRRSGPVREAFLSRTGRFIRGLLPG